ncbi:MAG: choice-of-anchor X domain-containing protein, partial [Panacibacter sp.]
MKLLLPTCIVAAILLASTLLLSWNHLDKKKQANGDNFFEADYKSAQYYYSETTFKEYDELFNTREDSKAPPADDVLVQRIPGDDAHLLLMAVYAFASYSGKTISLNTGANEIVLKDDGEANDKVAGDGIFTAKIPADVKEFRRMAILMEKANANKSAEPLFVNRDFSFNKNCITAPFNLLRLDNNEAVSIANLLDTGSDNLTDLVRKNCIFITDISVVEDPQRTWNFCSQTGNLNGAWSFKAIMRHLASQDPASLASGTRVSDFVKKWLETWTIQRIINGDTVRTRKNMNSKILDLWLQKSQAAGLPAGQLDMRFAPFKLTAVVNRFDLRERAAGIPAGEGRFVFCLINSNCTNSEDFTMVVEYGIPKIDNCDTLQDWARQWYNLKNYTLGSSEYNAALQAVTDQYARCGTSPGRPNQSSLDALRTGERALASTLPVRWEFRQFKISSTTPNLISTTISQVPADKYNEQFDNPDVRRMVKYINENKARINADNYTVPAIYDSFPFLGGKYTILDTPVGIPVKPYHWDGIALKGSPAYIRNTTTREFILKIFFII